MASMKAIKRRKASVTSTQHIMKAMNLVAASKLQKAKSKLDVVRPLYSNIKNVMDGVRASEGTEDNIFTEKRDVKNIAYVVITSDRGLCGGYNLNVAKEAYTFMEARPEAKEHIIAIGSKGWDFFKRRRKNVIQRFAEPAEGAMFGEAREIGGKLVSMYKSGEVDEVYVVYTHFNSILAHIPHIVRLLPVGSTSNMPEGHDLMTYDPDLNTFMTHAVPMYLNIFMYGAMVESAVCEQASRMTSMDAAARNASEIIDDLTLEFNRKRQGMITQEITEIVSGANALQ